MKLLHCKRQFTVSVFAIIEFYCSSYEIYGVHGYNGQQYPTKLFTCNLETKKLYI